MIYSLSPAGLGQTLPAPTATLKFLTLGRGTQNYTCASPLATPSAVGAKAALFDVSFLLEFPSPWNLYALDNSPRAAVSVPLSAIPSAVAARDEIGSHIFNAAGQPTFTLPNGNFLVAKKAGDIPAPTNSTPGPVGGEANGQDNGAVDWLDLADAGGSTGLSGAYRVECAGGKPPQTCAQAGLSYQEYSCLYWFYG